MVDPLILKIKKADDAPIKDKIKKILLFSKKVSDMKSISAIPAAKPSKPSIQLNAFIIATTKKQVIRILNSFEIE